MEPATLLAFTFFFLVEPIFILLLAPRLTQRRVKRDAISIIEAEMVPRIKAAVVAELAGVPEAEPESDHPRHSQEHMEHMTQVRRDMRAAEEEAIAAVVQQHGPAGLAIMEGAANGPRITRLAYRAALKAGPAAVVDLVDKVLKGRTGAPQQEVRYL